MKKILTIAALGGLFAASTAQADVNIYIAGSTAFRANVFRAVTTAFDGGAPTKINPANAGTGTGVYTAQGTISSIYGGQTVTIYASFNGSVQGLEDLMNNTSITFTNITPGGAAVPAVPTITFSDVDKISTLAANAAVTETPVAVLPFVYCRNYYTPTTVTNITGHQLLSLWANGLLPLSYITGNTSDYSKFMYVTGRNQDSGTRVCASADAFYTGTPTIYGYNNATTWEVMTQNLSGTLYGPGYSSGGNEASALTNQLTKVGGVGVSAIGYLGLNDALTVAGNASTGTGQGKNNGGGNCSIIAYDGVLPFNNYAISTSSSQTLVPAYPDFTPIIEGQYSFWSYENIETPVTHTLNQDTTYQYYTNMVQALDTDVLNAENAGGNSSTYGPVTAIRISEMKCSRSSVGGAITPN